MSQDKLAAPSGGAGWEVALSIITRTGFVFAKAALACLVLVVLWEVAMRRVFNAPTIWAFDLAGYLHAAAVLLAAGELLRKGEHITIDVFAHMLPCRLRAIVDFVVTALVVVASGWLTVVACTQALHAWSTAQVDWVSVWAPRLWPYYAIITFSMLSLFLAAFIRVVEAGRLIQTSEN